MIAINQLYKCGVCGNIVEVTHAGGGTLVCCGKDMNLLMENSVDAAKEKHVPIIEKTGDSVTVRVGSVAHPMEEKHYIEFIELITDTKVIRKMLKPGDKPEAAFAVNAASITARAYCNLHGLWKS
ncbi:MAG: desulfoferrodoxin [Candidatus Raymondbacteria bacterium RifOxyA12_full_50_37]|uniref:Desulfoferrodoxin n=1 Tax=Candidatus Raymondbacteria bacterium RIFOXYD12_FULL_49_13 TaxID=1817890 RepID=A0A1F7FKB6_UNCRA|nr:MAG: desulfoferrodoxin [Candidatus Raymondbacteria bacterium RifOxyA12_full_50_37]OGJ94535.1 MAG: desulfoferrodoxin [Candidatus Raymondbacteria bacterium RIFOXYA2_FULL_49_16]OGJ98514.1 MAG: desulfoferrodoxin [Candidatus Raymondbacteria bacterium RifOxyC12_full_50_8]OGK01684.1 MAG: desulfoferrodoxin [Candidatus Raymondbacteria bacterium RifOxyB12_full_50_8]OGK07011.1 MAG: desulfoferrodoxin [Candidatus Raymondbacteria bacterium RIFOXYD12_FULL_49_13]OGP45484.1 MAG: desulfoferrodoxin [Candidatu